MTKVFLGTTRFIPNHRLAIEVEGDGTTDHIEGVYDIPEFCDDEHGSCDPYWIFHLEKRHEADCLKLSFVIDDIVKSQQISTSYSNDTKYLFYFDDSIEQLSKPPDNSLVEKNRVSFPDDDQLPEEVRKILCHGYTNFVNYDNAFLQRWLKPMAFDLKDPKKDVWDVIVVGSGMGGGTVADALSEYGRKVLLLEAGTMLFQTNIYNLPGDHYESNKKFGVLNSTIVPPDSEDQPPSKLENTINMNLGGMSLFWTGTIPRIDAKELSDFWPESVVNFLNNDFGYLNAERRMHKQVTLGPFQEEVREFLQQQFPNYQIDDLPRSRHQPYISELQGRTILGNVLFNPTGMYSTIDQILDSTVKSKDKLSLRLNQIVREVKRPNGKDTEDFWEVHTYDLIKNIKRKYRSRCVVLSAGCIGSTAIVLRSELSKHKYAGKGATAHTFYQIEFGGEKESLHPRDFENIDVTSKDHCKIILREEGEPWFLQILINYEYWDRGVADEDVRFEITEEKGTNITLTFRFYIAHEIEEDNFIRVKEGTFKPEIYVKPYLPNSDLQERMRSVAIRVMKAFGIRRPIEAKHEKWDEKGVGYHLGGSLRMDGPKNDHDGVVDEDLMLKKDDKKKQQGLYVCDLSVFPYIPAANPSLTLVALAFRLATHINEKLNDKKSVNFP